LGENIPELSLVEAKELAKVFGEMDYKRSLILMLFSKPKIKYDVLQFMDRMPRASRVSRASLYRIVDELEHNGFLISADPRAMKNRPSESLSTYRLSIKGSLAAWIYSYVLLLDPKTPRSLMEKLNPEELLAVLDSTTGKKLYIEFLRWNRWRGNDLSRVKIDLVDLVSSFLPVVLKHHDTLSDQELALALSKVRDFGISAPQLEPALVRKLLEAWRKAMAGLEQTVLTRPREERS
jgi:hypothetical protein